MAKISYLFATRNQVCDIYNYLLAIVVVYLIRQVSAQNTNYTNDVTYQAKNQTDSPEYTLDLSKVNKRIVKDVQNKRIKHRSQSNDNLLSDNSDEQALSSAEAEELLLKLAEHPTDKGSLQSENLIGEESEEARFEGINSSNLINQVESDIEKLVRNQLDLAATDWARMHPTKSNKTQLIDSNFDNQNNTYDFLAYMPSTISPRWNSINADSISKDNNEDSSSESKLHSNHNYNTESINNIETTSQDPLTVSSDGSMRYTSTEFYQVPVTSSSTPSPNYSNKNHHLSNHLISKYMYRLRGPITSDSSVGDNQKHTSLKISNSVSNRQTPTLAPNVIKAFERLDRMRLSRVNNRDEIGTDKTIVDASEVKLTHEPSGAPKIGPNGFMDIVPGQTSHLIYSNGQQLIDGKQHNQIDWSDSPTGSGNIEDERKTTTTTTSKLSVDKDKLPAPAVQLTEADSSEGGSLAHRLNANRNKNKNKQQILTENQLTSLPNSSFRKEKLNNENMEPLILNLDNILSNRIKSPNLLDSAISTQPVQYYTEPSTRSISVTKQYARPQLRSSTTTMRPVSVKRPAINNLAPALYAEALNKLAKKRLLQLSSTSTTSTTTRTPPQIQTISPASSSNSASQTRPLASAQHHHLHSHIHSIKPAVISIPLASAINSQLVAPYSNLLAAVASSSNIGQVSKQTIRPISSVSFRKVKLPLPPKSSKPQLAGRSIPIGGTLASSSSISANRLQLNTQQRAPHSTQLNVNANSRSSILSSLIDSANKALKQVVLKGNTSPPLDKTEKLSATNPRGGGPEWSAFRQTYPVYQNHLEHESNEVSAPLSEISLFQSSTLDESNSPVEAYLADLLGNNLHYQGDITGELPRGFSELAQGYPPLKSSASNIQQIHQSNPLSEWIQANASSIERPNEDSVIFASLNDNSNFLYPIFSSSMTHSNNNPLDPSGLIQDFNQNQPFIGSEEQPSVISLPEESLWANISHEHQSNHLPPSSNKSTSRPPKGARGNKGYERSPLSSNKPNYFPTTSNPADSMPYALSHYVDEQQQHHSNSNNQPGTYKHAHSSSPQNNINNNNLLYDMFDDKTNKFVPTPPIQTPVEVYSTSSSDNPIETSSAADHHKSNFRYKNFDYLDHNPKQHLSKQPMRVHRDQRHKEPLPPPLPPITHYMHGIYQPATLQPTHLIQFHYPTSDQETMSPQNHQQTSSSASSLKPHLLAAGELINYHKQQLIDNHFLAHHYNPNVMHKNHLMHHHHHHPTDMATSETIQFPVASVGQASLLAHHFWKLAIALLPLMIVVAIVAQLIMAAPLAMFAITTLTVSRFAASFMGGMPLINRELGLSDPLSLSSNSIFNNSTGSLFTELPHFGIGNSTLKYHEQRTTSKPISKKA